MSRQRHVSVANAPRQPSADASLPPAERLLRLAHVLDDAGRRDGWHRSPLLVRVIERGDRAAELGICSLEGDHPLAALVGFRAPADWSVIGTIVGGNKHLLHGAGGESDQLGPGCHEGAPLMVRRQPGTEPERVRVVHLVHRSGHAVSIVRGRDEELHVDESEPTAVSRGRLDDACRRALGLATSSPADAPRVMWAGAWLDRVMAATMRGPRSAPQSWSDLAALHPLAPKLSAQRASRLLGRADIERAIEQMGRAWSWEQLRLACASNHWQVEGIEPQWAAWMDAGMFSRWVMQQLPEVSHAIDCLRANLPENLTDDVVELLARFGLRPRRS